MTQESTYLVLEKFLLDPKAKLWETDFPLDPILSPFSDTMVSAALSVNKEDIAKLSSRGIIEKTCCIEFGNDEKQFFSNYWDILQASICFSLIEVNVQVDQAIEFAAGFCDFLACLYEEESVLQPLGVESLLQILLVEMQSLTSGADLELVKIKNRDVYIKVAVDLINTHVRLCDANSYTRSPPILVCARIKSDFPFPL